MDPVRLGDDLERALGGLEPETRRALGRALERGSFELEGGEWGAQGDGAGCLLSLAAWELGLDDGETLMTRSIDAVRVPALFDAWWADLLEREGDVIRARRTARDLIGQMLHRGLAGAPRARDVVERPEPAAEAERTPAPLA
jgi:hypothetical protein